ncbi:nickel pincer cofactor biosynthesis protein LarC [Actinacidiphila paucisporea]|uniref:Pyridinium-3,5-bisthiocarboxylic acid mononucleotide nickel chelatase n=1 Tax=Actinacidiphila paucisporea TaxID=310782 RepID=A0A1M7NLV2_9ACTN|nr:nickel pincer cofactor biosynthesis protein LarC [Actinacidiphila paucisporea]SHN04731.1 hypothetical protein SAMN05216499_11937 [Actinacidiphila paucisporea]
MICWINPFTGLAGDMLLAALLDAGAPIEAVRQAIGDTGLNGWALTAEHATDHGLRGVRAHVEVTDEATERRAAELIEMASRATPQPVADMAVAALRALAVAEAHLHGTEPDLVHLHEIGGHDTVVDIVGVAAALHALGVTDTVCAPLPLATGNIRSAHGILPGPAPATLELLRGAEVTGSDLPGETVTPTGAALLHAAGARYGGMPAMTLATTGYGLGSRRLGDRANVTVVALGRTAALGTGTGPAEPGGDEDVVTLATNLDDVTAETLAHVVARALDAGALDAWITPALMKKGRPGHVLSVLARPAQVAELGTLLAAETGSLGLRVTGSRRRVLERSFGSVLVDGCRIGVKHGPYGSKPEHDDVAAAAAVLGLPLRTVAARALRLATPAEPDAAVRGLPEETV